MAKAALATENSTNVQSNKRLALWRRGFGLAEQVSAELAARMATELFLSTRRRPRPAREALLLSRGTRFELGAGAVAWSFGSGPAVLLAHGWEGRGAQLGAFVEPLVERGYRAVTFDARGHGDGRGRRATLLDFAEAALRVSWHTGPLHAVIAHSFGGPGICVALERGLSANGAVFLAPPSSIERGFLSFGELFSLAPRTVSLMKEQVERRAGVALAAIEPLRIARRMTIPLAVIHDVDDAEVPYREGLALARAWPNATFHPTRGLGHKKILWAPEVVRTALRFVDGLAVERRRELDRFLDVSA